MHLQHPFALINQRFRNAPTPRLRVHGQPVNPTSTHIATHDGHTDQAAIIKSPNKKVRLNPHLHRETLPTVSTFRLEGQTCQQPQPNHLIIITKNQPTKLQTATPNPRSIRTREI